MFTYSNSNIQFEKPMKQLQTNMNNIVII